MFTSLSQFYTSQEWRTFRELVIAENMQQNGGVIRDEFNGKIIDKSYDVILHHKKPLTMQNVNDYSISLNRENILVVSHRSHNEIHNRFGYCSQRKVYYVYGSPCAGKTSFVNRVKGNSDLVIDMDIKKLTSRKNKILTILKNAKREQLENALPVEIYNELSAEYYEELKQIEKDILIYKASVDFEITPENVEAYLTSFLKAETHNDKALKHLFDRFVNRIDISDDAVILTLAVCPVSRDSLPNGQPHYKLSLQKERCNFSYQHK